jgi:hypothetical protein
MRASASALARLGKLRKPASQVGVMLLPPVFTLDAWEALAVVHQNELFASCARDRSDYEDRPTSQRARIDGGAHKSPTG